MEWQPIDRPPNRVIFSKRVLVYCDGKVVVAEYSRILRGWYGEYGRLLQNPTHWMPLPPPPKENE